MSKSITIYILIIVLAMIVQPFLLNLPWINPIFIFIDKYFITVVIGLLCPSAYKRLIQPFINNLKSLSKRDNQYQEQLQNAQSALEVMRTNLKEVSGYYLISKKQANNSYFMAILACSIGFLLICAGILIMILKNDDKLSASIVTSAGAIGELVGLLFLAIYFRTLTQINLYYESLNVKERFLTCVELVEKLESKKEDTYIKIIESEINRNPSPTP